MYTAKLELPKSDQLFEALTPEKNNGNERCTVEIKKTKESIIIKLKAKDIVALRAFLTSITRLIQIYEGLKNE